MAEICCKTCDSQRCDGCNIYVLANALNECKLDKFLNEHRSIDLNLLKNYNDCSKCMLYISHNIIL